MANTLTLKQAVNINNNVIKLLTLVENPFKEELPDKKRNNIQKITTFIESIYHAGHENQGNYCENNEPEDKIKRILINQLIIKAGIKMLTDLIKKASGLNVRVKLVKNKKNGQYTKLNIRDIDKRKRILSLDFLES